jgi:hypothetical protein
MLSSDEVNFGRDILLQEDDLKEGDELNVVAEPRFSSWLVGVSNLCRWSLIESNSLGRLTHEEL